MIPALAHSSALDGFGRRLRVAFERVVEAYAQRNARRGLRRLPILTGIDGHLLHDLGLNPIGVEVGFIQPQY
jgi:hypothetical protein